MHVIWLADDVLLFTFRIYCGCVVAVSVQPHRPLFIFFIYSIFGHVYYCGYAEAMRTIVGYSVPF